MTSLKTLARSLELLTLETYSPLEETREKFLRLDLNENLSGCSPRVVEAIRQASIRELSTYPVYSATAQMIADVEGCEPSEILITAGIDDGIRTIFEAFLAPNEKLALVVPTFTMYEIYARIRGAEIVSIPFSSNFSYPMESVLETIRVEKPKIFVIVSPNNPTGTFLSEDEIESLVQQIRSLSPQTLIVIDEAYREFAQVNLSFLTKKYDNVLLMRTFSKSYGLAGLRIGYVMSAVQIIAFLRKVASPFPVSQLACVAAQAALSDEEFLRNYVDEIAESRALVKETLEKMGFKVVDSRANFLLVKFGSINDWLNEKLREKKILIRNRSNEPLLQGYSRITLGNKQTMSVFLQAIDDILSEPILLFDMDGVLVDVSQSYDETIRRCVEYFTQQSVSEEEIHSTRQQEGFNNDWLVVQELIREQGKQIELSSIKSIFQEIYKDNESKERWLLEKSLLEKLAQKYRLGIVTGRPREEALSALKRFQTEEYFLSVVTLNDVPQDKPDPSGIRLSLKRLKGKNALFFGDTINDVLAAKRAGITSVGILNNLTVTFGQIQEFRRFVLAGKGTLAPSILPSVLDDLRSFLNIGADYVLPTINDLEVLLS